MSDSEIKPVPAALQLLPAFAFGIVMTVGLIVSLLSLRDVPNSAWDGIGDFGKIASGESTRRFTGQLNDHFIWGKTFALIERAVTWNVVGDTGTAVSAGCPGWFFLNEELEVHPDRINSAASRAQLIARLTPRLQARGVQLVVAVVPDKTRIEQAHLCGLHRPPRFAQRLDDWISQLRSQHIEVVDLNPILSGLPGERYYRTDSHWNEAGSFAAAQAIAMRLIELKLVDEPAPPPNPAALTKKMAKRPGDLLRVANLEPLPAWLKPNTEITQITEIAPTASTSNDLFGDEGLPKVVLVGTSFSRVSNFVPFLSFHLGAPVSNLAKDGGNFEGAAMSYLSSSAYLETPPKVVLWEVPERMLEKPLSLAEKQWLEFLAVK